MKLAAVIVALLALVVRPTPRVEVRVYTREEAEAIAAVMRGFVESLSRGFTEYVFQPPRDGEGR